MLCEQRRTFGRAEASSVRPTFHVYLIHTCSGKYTPLSPYLEHVNLGKEGEAHLLLLLEVVPAVWGSDHYYYSGTRRVGVKPRLPPLRHPEQQIADTL